MYSSASTIWLFKNSSKAYWQAGKSIKTSDGEYGGGIGARDLSFLSSSIWFEPFANKTSGDDEMLPFPSGDIMKITSQVVQTGVKNEQRPEIERPDVLHFDGRESFPRVLNESRAQFVICNHTRPYRPALGG